MADLTAEATENYLKQIYHLSLEAAPVKTSRLAQALHLSPGSVTEMLKRLEEQKLVAYRPYRGVSLTRRGRKRALLVVRRHRLWEVFLHRVLQMPWSEIHQHAERLEHATDDHLAQRLDEFLGHPPLDPHGHPIPGPDGTIAEGRRLRLTSLPVGTRVAIAQCTADANPSLLDYLNQLGLVPGVRLTIGPRAPLEGPLTVEVEGQPRHIGFEAARTLLVEVVDAVGADDAAG